MEYIDASRLLFMFVYYRMLCCCANFCLLIYDSLRAIEGTNRFVPNIRGFLFPYFARSKAVRLCSREHRILHYVKAPKFVHTMLL